MNLDQIKLGIIGLGYVGLLLTVEFGKKRSVVRFDVNPKRNEELRSGVDVTLELDAKELSDASELSFSTNLEDLRACGCFIVTVPTPVDEHHGKITSDFTFVDDIVESIVRVIDKPATLNPNFDTGNPDPVTSSAPYRKFNVVDSQPTPFMHYIAALENALGIEAQKNFLPLQPGDVLSTASDTAALEAWTGFKPKLSVHQGVARFPHWYREYYQV